MRALILDLKQALGLLGIVFAALGPYPRRSHSPLATVMLIGTMPCVVLGGPVAFADPDLFRLLIGLVAPCLDGVQKAGGWASPRPPKRQATYIVGIAYGAVASFISFVGHAGGPLAAIWLLGRGVAKTENQTSVPVFLVVNLMKLPAYALLGSGTIQMLWIAPILLPLAIAGVWRVVHLDHRLSGRIFFALTYVFLVLAGIKLIVDALT